MSDEIHTIHKGVDSKSKHDGMHNLRRVVVKEHTLFVGVTLQMAMPDDAGNTGGTPIPNIVPSIFISSDQGDHRQRITLRSCSRKLWHLNIEKQGDSWHFTDGWKEFVKDNKITGGDVLAYESPCEGLIDFKIRSPSGLEEGVEHLDYKDAKGQEERVDGKAEGVHAADNNYKNPTAPRDHHPEHEQKMLTLLDAGVSVRKKKRNRHSDLYGEELFNSGEFTQPVNPYFVTVVNKTKVNELYIPAEVVRCYDVELPEMLVAVDSTGRRFRMKRRKGKDGRAVFYGGWKAVCNINLAQENDRIICEFVTEEGGDVELLVSFVHAK